MKNKSNTQKKSKKKIIACTVGAIFVIGFFGSLGKSGDSSPTPSDYENTMEANIESSAATTKAQSTTEQPTTTEAHTTTEAVTEQTSTAEITTEAPTTTEAVTTQAAEANASSEKLVWVSETGKRYHSKNTCYPINPDNARQVPLSEALEMGLTPCGKCYK